MKITVCESAGFCYGVKRAADMLDGLLEQGKRVCTLGPLAHNNSFLAELARRGVRTINDPSELADGECLLIRAHGITSDMQRSIEESGIEFYDATCPSVAKIHRLAASITDKNALLIVAGDSSHPEIIGILGHASCRTETVKNASELDSLLSRTPDIGKIPVFALSQTTFSVFEWKKCRKIIENHCTNPKIFDTICNTTHLRQTEAERTASVCDLMIVIGSGQSSNTAKLFEVCAKHTRTVLIENSDELDTGVLRGCRNVGITAGASTPVKNILEVVQIMDEEKNILPGQEETIPTGEEEFNFETELERSFGRLSKTDTIKGIVIGITPGEVAVDIGRKHSAYIPLAELTDDPNAKTTDLVKLGDELELMILKTNDVDGTVMMSKKRVDASANWASIVAAKDSGEVLEGTVVENVKAGVIVMCNGNRIFIPASQTGIPRDGDLDTLLKQAVRFIVIDIEDRNRRKRAVGSIRKASTMGRKEAAEKFWETAKVGDVVIGRVRSIADFGVFVNIGGPDGLVHKTELSWEHFKNISDIVTVGQELKVIIKDLDPEKRRISLTAKMPEDDPFNKFLEQYKVGDKVTVTITSIALFGAFGTIIPGVEGLIHISNIANGKTEKVSDVLSKEQQVEVKIIGIDTVRKKVSLSIKALQEPEQAEAASTEDVVVATLDDPTDEAK